MNIPIRRGIPSQLESQYAELKKQAVADRELNQKKNTTKEQISNEGVDKVTLSSLQPDTDNPAKRKPSQPVTPIEIQALLTQFSVNV